MIEEVKIGHIADSHLGKRQYGLGEREEDFYDAFKEACNKLLEKGIDILLLSGDVFDSSRPPNKALLKFEESVRGLIENGVKIYAISGDHDFPKRRDVPPLMLFARLGIKYLWTGDICAENNDYIICGIQSHPRSFREKALKLFREVDIKFRQKDRFKILMLHQGLSNFSRYASEFSLEELPRNVNYYAMGHLHSFIYKKLNGSFLVYPGSLEIVDITEIEEYKLRGKGPVVVEVVGENKVKVEKIRLENIRPQIIVEAEEAEYKYLVDRIMAELEKAKHPTKNPIVHVYIREDISREVIQKINMALKDQVLLVRFRRISGVSKPILGTVSEEDGYEGAIDLREMFLKYLENEELVNLAEKLLDLIGKEGSIEDGFELVMQYYRKRVKQGVH
ncbi:MAG: hypothetical protein DRJ35_02565 [Thermoprotei archaeon]|nr:MAG: hypothetical protein DRJ35_02565 [Thermoprotei archaeon]